MPVSKVEKNRRTRGKRFTSINTTWPREVAGELDEENLSGSSFDRKEKLRIHRPDNIHCCITHFKNIDHSASSLSRQRVLTRHLLQMKFICGTSLRTNLSK